MKISADRLKENLLNGCQTLLLMGPSGIGKTQWSERLRDELTSYPRFAMIEMDARIGQSNEMKGILHSMPGQDEAEKMGVFFGKPWEDINDFSQKEAQYLRIEADQMATVARDIRSHQQLAIDLTGSAIYCAQELRALAKKGLTVYLRATQDAYDQMKQTYMSDPKPVCWGTMLSQWQKGATQKDLPELYGQLLCSRDALYEQYADVVIPWHIHRSISTADAFLDAVIQRLSESTSYANF